MSVTIKNPGPKFGFYFYISVKIPLRNGTVEIIALKLFFAISEDFFFAYYEVQFDTFSSVEFHSFWYNKPTHFLLLCITDTRLCIILPVVYLGKKSTPILWPYKHTNTCVHKHKLTHWIEFLFNTIHSTLCLRCCCCFYFYLFCSFCSFLQDDIRSICRILIWRR